LRADHLPFYGYGRNTAPRIEQFASQGVIFDQAIAQASWTLPSMASALTSLYPAQHGANQVNHPLPDEVTTLAEVLRDAGYRTAAVVSHGFVGRTYAFSQGFDAFDDSNAKGHDAVTSPALTRLGLARFKEARNAPLFLWVHYFDPHLSYIRHPEYAFADGYRGEQSGPLSYRALGKLKGQLQSTDPEVAAREVDHVRNVYDEEIRFTDHWIGMLVDGIHALGRDRPTAFILTSDHGEYFMERGRFGHGADVYDELVRVPLIVFGAVEPQLRGKRVRGFVELASVPKTVSGLARIADHPFQGVDLLAVADGRAEPQFAFSEGISLGHARNRKQCVVYEGWKLIHNLDAGVYELYDTNQDPRERNNLWDHPDGQGAKERLLPALTDFSRMAPADAAEIELSEGEKAKLRALGYLESP